MKPARRLFLLLLWAILSPSAHGSEPSYGLWEGGDTAAESIYGKLCIAKGHISWGRGTRSHPRCRVRYTVVEEPVGTEFQDQQGKAYVTSNASDFDTALLELANAQCTAGMKYLRVTIKRDEPTYLALVEYQSKGKATGFMHFFKRSESCR